MIERDFGKVAEVCLMGGGIIGKTRELDAEVRFAAELLEKAYGSDVVIRFAADGISGGAFLRHGFSDKLHMNDASIGLLVSLENRVLMKLSEDERRRLSWGDWKAYLSFKDTLLYHTYIDLNLTKNHVEPNSPHITRGLAYLYESRSFPSLSEAAEYLISHAAGVKT